MIATRSQVESPASANRFLFRVRACVSGFGFLIHGSHYIHTAAQIAMYTKSFLPSIFPLFFSLLEHFSLKIPPASERATPPPLPSTEID